MVDELNVYWSTEAKEQVNRIKEFIRQQWSEKEVDLFLDLLDQFEALVKLYPNGYQRSIKFSGCRRAVIHPHVSVIYRRQGKEIRSRYGIR